MRHLSLYRQQLLRQALALMHLEPAELKPALVRDWFGESGEEFWPRTMAGERKLFRDLRAVRGPVQDHDRFLERLKRAADAVPEIGIKRAALREHVNWRQLNREMRRRGFVYVNHGHRGEFSGWFPRDRAKARAA